MAKMAGYGPMARMRDMGLVECELDISPCRIGAVVAKNELNKMVLEVSFPLIYK